MTRLLHLPSGHPLRRVSDAVQAKLAVAQGDTIDVEFASAAEFVARICDDLKSRLTLPATLKDETVRAFSDRSHKDLLAFFADVLRANAVPEPSIRLQAESYADRAQLLRAFRDPDDVVAVTCEKVVEIIADFPTRAEDVQCGRNPGDVLDPYILAATQHLMHAGNFESTISATVTHKVLMIIEGLLGHLHEDVIGSMRGNVRAPEPGGSRKEILDAECNPFPGADIVQPPLATGRPLRFHQVKSKTGSAKGGDGRRLGLQLARLRELYGGQLFYSALVGNTLRGHRSIAGVLDAAPDVVVLVGEAAFRELTDSANGPQLLLRLYQSAFEVAARRSGYDVQAVVASIYASFKARADEHGEQFLEAILREAVCGPPGEQDSRTFARRPRSRRDA